MTRSPSLGRPATAGNPCTVWVPSTPVFSPARLDEILTGVFSLRDHWTEHGPGFYALGFAHYKEGRDGPLAADEVEASNARLDEAFGPALEDLRALLARELGAEVVWGSGLPLPGFHILEAAALSPGRPTGDSHFDLQYSVAPLGGPVRETLSMTIPIQVPAAGASLEHWPVDFAEAQRLINGGALADLEEVQAHFPMQTATYEPGKACLQRGLPLHRMGPTATVDPTDHRITLQGHAALVGDRWIGYW